mmetsp:Transcript_75101/g.149128  ORF Transcript_75101/g.149128 Transcript_75101/m.149128 type:complete len:441 (-) Transcript_75101:272-1594(-)|eukprot:CAMPEP_0174723526 /NCGR_PEP_ID=MMETSP1094-20130205/41188_1 /TAXON_ID=156173 /ORGANISM="Chrysochromulina brevifilum, Strain UTEX LB 985" /LENGTH=440 /DNA_ID=CAMNT_0015924587 /DNA_START=77 /DNA_END=1399 /DNA_ORIENTATION=-
MELEFEAAAKRFSKDQGTRKQQMVEKKERQARERAALKARQEKWEKEAEKRREEEAARQAAEAEMRDIDLERNRGVAFVRSGLQPQLSHAAEAKGIRRSQDKISLPRSCQTELDEQHASKNGQLFFELSTASGRTTCASILDFSAPEGTVGLPAPVLRCLGLDAMADGGSPSAADVITVRYRALKTGTSARVQPVLSSFAADVDDIKGTLERELLLRTTLTEGDELMVRDTTLDAALGGGSAAASYQLKIIGLEPEPSISLIDTDLEVTLLPSVQAEEAEAERARAEAERQRRLEAAIEARRQEEAAAEEAAAAAERAAAEERAAETEARAARRTAAAVALGVEPEAGEGTISIAVRCPDGTRCSHRFRGDAPLALLFALVEASAWETLAPSFTLTASYPRRVFRREDAADGRSLVAAGLSGKQEALFVEVASEPEPMQE